LKIEDPLRLFKIFHHVLDFFINKYRNVAVQGKWMEIAKFLLTAAGQFCLLSYWLAAGMWAFPSGFPTPFEPFPMAVQQPLRAFPSGCWLKRGNFQLFFLKGLISVYIF
jgi:hypothetical protein